LQVRASLASLLLLLLASAVACSRGPAAPAAPPDLPGIAPLDRPVSWEADVKPLLDSRCVVCHACYDAPCQLQLSSYEGTLRGATQEPVYDSSRIEAMKPTRLFVDAQSNEEWRARKFFAVVGPEAMVETASRRDPLLLGMLALGRAHPFADGQRLPAELPLDIDRKLSCPNAPEFAGYAREHPQGGMPYGMAPLSGEELGILATWAAQPPSPPKEIPLSARTRGQVQHWEAFLNGDSLKEQISARYLYEHWFMAHLVLDGLPAGPFFELVRSKTPPGQPIDVIATVRPYEDPGVPRVWYRLRPVRSTIVHKTHIVYPFGEAKLRRVRELFVRSPWQPTRLPGYSAEEASNPFLAFDQIPARSRYQFLLDDAQYFVMTFIRGPVCRGQIAVDVIEDRFWIAFADPEHDLSVRDPSYLEETKKLLSLPAEHGNRFLPGASWLEFNRLQRKYLEKRVDFYDAIDPQRRGPSLDWLWDGGRRNDNALLSVFRNYDNATVVRGFVGATPKTAWVMDYPIFERIYYNLVAGFDIYGNLVHQVSTRLYMDHLRMQSENLFLMLLPADQREAIRDSWYVGAGHQLSVALTDRLRATDHGTQIRYTTQDPKAELLEMIRAHAGPAAGDPDTINRCAKPPCERRDAGALERGVERELERIASRKGDFVALLPEVSFLRVKSGSSGGRDLVYALVRDVAHKNVAFMFGEEKRLIPEDDTLTIVRGHFGSYPNFFFETDAAGVTAFVDELSALRSDADLERFAGRFGIRRTSARFWDTVDWLHADLARRDPTGAGLYDLDRYGNL
jgi:hypothetical protein